MANILDFDSVFVSSLIGIFNEIPTCFTETFPQISGVIPSL